MLLCGKHFKNILILSVEVKNCPGSGTSINPIPPRSIPTNARDETIARSTHTRDSRQRNSLRSVPLLALVAPLYRPPTAQAQVNTAP